MQATAVISAIVAWLLLQLQENSMASAKIFLAGQLFMNA
jgi:hypothetical protein